MGKGVVLDPAPTLDRLAETAVAVPASTTCADLDAIFRADPALTSVAVTEGAQTGLVMRDEFAQVMSGPFGYGRTLWARRPVGEVTNWAPLDARATDSVVATAQRLRTRSAARRFDDVLVHRGDTTPARVSAAQLFDALARHFAHRAIHDDLTGLVNRSHFLELLATACAEPGPWRVALAVVDLDGLKRINDSFGHVMGDAVLMRVARHLEMAAGPGEVTARLGADEFAVLGRVPPHEATETRAREFGERLRRAVIAPDGTVWPFGAVGASAGVAIANDRADATTLLAEADMTLFRAKQGGGGQTQSTLDVGSELALDVTVVDRSVADAITHNELDLWYQPIVRIRDNATTGIEALVRWNHPTAGLLGPDRFLPGAYRAGHLPDLDRWVLTRACADFAHLVDALGERAPSRVAVNIAPATLATSFDEMVANVLAATGLSADRLRLELPEDADLTSLAAADARLERLRRLGVDLVLDDMGAGSTSLRHLSTVSIGGLKIDAAFIAGMLHNPRDHTVVKLLADLGRGLNVPIVAEGVEQADQLAALAELDIEYAQGYYLGRPQPFHALATSLGVPLPRMNHASSDGGTRDVRPYDRAAHIGDAPQS